MLYVRRGHFSRDLNRFSFDCGWTLTASGVGVTRAQALAQRLHDRVHSTCAAEHAALDRAYPRAAETTEARRATLHRT